MRCGHEPIERRLPALNKRMRQTRPDQKIRHRGPLTTASRASFKPSVDSPASYAAHRIAGPAKPAGNPHRAIIGQR